MVAESIALIYLTAGDTEGLALCRVGLAGSRWPASRAMIWHPACSTVLSFEYSAAALCLERTTPLGLVLLAPVAAILVLLAWHFRSAYRPLWSYSVAHKEAKV